MHDSIRGLFGGFDGSFRYKTQIDDNLDKQRVNHKFVNARLALPDVSVKAVFITSSNPKKPEAEGLLKAVNAAFVVAAFAATQIR